jgi:hypothetical protein
MKQNYTPMRLPSLLLNSFLNRENTSGDKHLRRQPDKIVLADQ